MTCDGGLMHRKGAQNMQSYVKYPAQYAWIYKTSVSAAARTQGPRDSSHHFSRFGSCPTSMCLWRLPIHRLRAHAKRRRKAAPQWSLDLYAALQPCKTR